MAFQSYRARDASDRLFVWLAVISTIAAGAVYVYFVR